MAKSEGGEELREFLNRMEELEKNVPQIINELAVHEGEVIAGMIKNITPVRVVDGGTLRSGFHSYRDAGKSDGKKVTVTIANNVKYASFVEKGHRKRNNKGWVQGRFMMRISVRLYKDNVMEGNIRRFIGKKLREYIDD